MSLDHERILMKINEVGMGRNRRRERPRKIRMEIIYHKSLYCNKKVIKAEISRQKKEKGIDLLSHF